MKLSGRVKFGFRSEPFVARIEEACDAATFRLRNLSGSGPAEPRLRIGSDATPDVNEICFDDGFRYLAPGDIVRLNPISEEARVLYRRNSRHNFLFFTERCNSRCLMCSQPPREIDDGYLVDDILRIIPWMSPATPELGITGGEPTLLHDRLIQVLAATRDHLPETAVHLLTNGRLLSYFQYARKIAEVGHPDLMLGIPVYSDLAAVHDFVVQAEGAFGQTIYGLMNLARVGVRIEIRMVVHRQTNKRLPQFARFVARNLPFASQVVFMGLELTGFARPNLESLWVDPADYQDELEQAVSILDDAGIKVFVFNHQLCLLRPSLQPFARKSISDWKNVFMPDCAPCVRKDECGGFFASAGLRYSKHIKPYTTHTAPLRT